VLLLECGLEFVLVTEVAQVGAVFKLGLQVGGVHVWCSSWDLQVGCCDFAVSIFRWIKPPHHVKVNPLGKGNQALRGHTLQTKNLPRRHYVQSRLRAYMISEVRVQLLVLSASG
jgi:hypothetical protein